MSNRKDLESLVTKLNKKFGENAMTLGCPKDSKGKVKELQRISTGSLSLNVSLGGGIPVGRFTEINGAFSAGKGQPLDAILPTPAGDKKMGDLKVNDFVFGSDGKPTKVLAIYDRGIIDTYKVIFSDGANIVVDSNHLWALDRVDRPRLVLPTKNLEGKKLQGYYIPIASPLQYDFKDPDVDPRLLGLYISGRYITEDPLNYSYLYKVGLFGLEDSERFIPPECFLASIEFRTELLRGLMDVKGSLKKSNNVVYSPYYKTTSTKLSHDVIRLVTSLGGTSSKTKPKDSSVMSLRVTTPFNPFKFSDQVDSWRMTERNRRSIKEVVPNGKLLIRCIMVEAQDHLYIADTQYSIVTHNTTQSLHIIREAQKIGLKCALLDVEGTTDENYLKSIGVNFKDLIYMNPDGTEEATQALLELQRSEIVHLAVLDSFASLSPTKEYESDMDESVQMGLQPKILGEYFRKYTASNNRLSREGKMPFTLIGLNQLREAIGKYGDPEFSPGGKRNALQLISIV